MVKEKVASSNTGFRSGYVAVVGRPNVGKSTLVNAIIGQKIAIVSPKPQTTRRMQLGIHSDEKTQFMFFDTPGVHKPRHALGRTMVASVNQAILDADVVLWVVDVSRLPNDGDKNVSRRLRADAGGKPIVLAMNKSDRLRAANVLSHTNGYRMLLPQATWMLVSALRGDNLSLLLDRVKVGLPLGAHCYPEDQVTSTTMRELAADLIRESALYYLHQEVPHGVGVLVSEYDDSDVNEVNISATIIVESKRHKAIIIGRNGAMLGIIGATARRKIANMCGSRVNLHTLVVVKRGWRNDLRTVGRMSESLVGVMERERLS